MLIFHIVAGSFVLLFGIGALCFSKGQSLHRLSGNLFFLSLLLMAGSAAFLTDDPTMAISSVYFASTAWAVVLRPEKSTGIFEIIAMFTITIVSVNILSFVMTSTSLSTTYTFIFYILGSVAALAALLDLNMIIRGGLSGKHRIARHAWRTCYALLGAVMSFSANTSDKWPDFINSNFLIYLVIGILFFWLFRVLFTKWFDKSKSVIGNSKLLKTVFGN